MGGWGGFWTAVELQLQLQMAEVAVEAKMK